MFDNDVMTKREIRQALDRVTAHLQCKGAHVTAVYLPHVEEQAEWMTSCALIPCRP